MEQYTYKVCPKFDKPCSKLRVEILSENGVEIACEDEGCIKVKLKEGSTNHCIEFFVFCEDCGSCPPKYIKKCFCKVDTDCADCEKCNELGVCESKCKPTEFCVGDKCVECDPTHPCPNGKICKDGKCICPQGKFEYLGKCVECTPNTPLGKCRVCVNGVIQPIPCDGGCDEIDGCVECIKTGDCANRTDGRNCCNDKKCECCPGFIYDYELKKCVPKPPCTSDEECGPCKKCTPLGCVDVICPDKFKCDPLVNDCIPDPCNSAPCDNGTDCGKDCGCKDKICTECAKLSCEECAKTLGCVCNPITNLCEKDNKCDETPCETKHDCSQDCGCDKSVCQECSNFSCEECAKRPGCKCVNGKCVGDGDRGCKDTFTLAPNKCDASLTAKLIKAQPCSCETITSKVVIEAGLSNVIKLSIRKGFGDFNALLPLLDPAALNNSETENQLTSLDVKLTLTALDVNGIQVKAPNSVIKSYTSINENTQLGAINVSGLTQVQIGKIAKVKLTVSIVNLKFRDNKCSYEDKVLFEDLFNPSFTATTVTFKSDDLAEQVVKYAELSSSDFRDPLFVWYRSKNSAFGVENIIRKKYVSLTNGSYTDKLGLEEGFLPKFDYRVEPGCTCASPATLEDVVICEDLDLPIKLLQCNTKLEFTDDIKLCDLSNTSMYPYQNRGSILKPNTFDDVAYASVSFDLLINGVKKATFTADDKKILYRPSLTKQSVKGYMIDNGTEPITSVSLVVEVDGVVKCEVKENFPEAPIVFPKITTTCNEDSSEISVKFDANANHPLTKVVFNNGITANFISNTATVLVDKDGDYVFDLYFLNSCVKQLKQSIVCCDKKAITISKSSIDTTPITESTLTSSASSLIPFEGAYYKINTKGYSSFVKPTTDFGTVTNDKQLFLSADQVRSIANSGSRSITVSIEENDCKKEVVLVVKVLNVSLTVSDPSCLEGKITLTGTEGYTYTLGTYSGVLPSSGFVELDTTNGPLASKTYNLTLYNSFPTTLSVTYQKSSTPTINSFSIGGQDDCNNDFIVVNLTGTNLIDNTKVTYRVGLNSDPQEITITKDGLATYFRIPKTGDDIINLYLDKVSNGDTCQTALTISDTIEVKVNSVITVNTPVCNASTLTFTALLSLPVDFNPSEDSVQFVTALPSPLTYNPTTRIISGIPQNSDYDIDATLYMNGIQRCTTTLSIDTLLCNCSDRSITSVTAPVMCKKSPNTGLISNLTRTISSATDITIAGGSGLTFTNLPTSKIKVYLIKGTGVLNETQLLPGSNGGKNNDINYNSGTGKLSINSIQVEKSFFNTINYNDLAFSVRVIPDGSYCEKSVDIPIVVNNLDSALNTDLNINFYYNNSTTAFNSVTLGDLTTMVGVDFHTKLSISVSSVPPQPSNLSVKIVIGASTYIFTGDEINLGNVTKVIYDPNNGLLSGLTAVISKTLGDNTCTDTVKTIEIFDQPNGSTSVTRYNGSIYQVVNALQTLCVLDGANSFSYIFGGSQTVVGFEWSYDGIVIGTSATISIDPTSGFTLDNLPKLLQVKLTLDDSTESIGFVYVAMKNSVSPVFSTLPMSFVYTGAYGGTFTLPTSSTNSPVITGTWTPPTLDTSTPTSSSGPKSSVFTPTGGQCATTYPFTLQVNNLPPISIPNVEVTGPSSGCGSVELLVSLQNAGVVFISTNPANFTNCPPTGATSDPNVLYTGGVYSTTAGTNTPINFTQTGTYYFVAYDTSGPTCSTSKNHSITVTQPTAAEFSTPLPTSFEYGDVYTLPNPITTPSGPLSGVWTDVSSSTVTTVSTTTLGSTFYRFTPDAGTCKTYVDYTPNIVCPSGNGYTQSESLGSFNFTLQAPFDTLSWEVRQSSTIISSGSSTTILKNATNFPNAGDLYQIYITASIGVSTCSIESFFGNYCRCSSPSCTSVQPCTQSLYKDSGHTELISGITTVLTNWELKTGSPYDSFICKAYTLSNNSPVSGVLQEFCLITPASNYKVTVALSGTLNIEGVNIVRGASETQAAFVNRVNLSYPGALIADTGSTSVFKFNVKLYTTTNSISSNNNSWYTGPGGGHSGSYSNNSCGYIEAITNFDETYVYDEGLSYSANVAAMIALYNTSTIDITSINQVPNNILTNECQQL